MFETFLRSTIDGPTCDPHHYRYAVTMLFFSLQSVHKCLGGRSGNPGTLSTNLLFKLSDSHAKGSQKASAMCGFTQFAPRPSNTPYSSLLVRSAMFIADGAFST